MTNLCILTSKCVFFFKTKYGAVPRRAQAILISCQEAKQTSKRPNFIHSLQAEHIAISKARMANVLHTQHCDTKMKA